MTATLMLNLSDDLHGRLTRSAEAHGRSVCDEAIAILALALLKPEETVKARPARIEASVVTSPTEARHAHEIDFPERKGKP